MTDRLLSDGGGISQILGQPWPANRKEIRRARAAYCDSQTRQIICAICEKRSPLLLGPESRAWWNDHVTKCKPRHLRVVA